MNDSLTTLGEFRRFTKDMPDETPLLLRRTKVLTRLEQISVLSDENGKIVIPVEDQE